MKSWLYVKSPIFLLLINFQVHKTRKSENHWPTVPSIKWFYFIVGINVITNNTESKVSQNYLNIENTKFLKLSWAFCTPEGKNFFPSTLRWRKMAEERRDKSQIFCFCSVIPASKILTGVQVAQRKLLLGMEGWDGAAAPLVSQSNVRKLWGYAIQRR
jgi:hypothetical protein